MDPFIIPIVALLIPIIIVPIALGTKHARYLREVEHAERMRAMDLGVPYAEDEKHAWTPAGLAGTIGAGVPLAAMVLAFASARSIRDLDVVRGIIQLAAMLGLGGVICGTILAAQLFSRREKAAPVDSLAEKPSYDPDAFDVVGRRG